MSDNLVIIAGGGIGGLATGTFDNIDDVIPPAEREEFMTGYKRAAGYAMESLNKAARTIPEGARVASA